MMETFVILTPGVPIPGGGGGDGATPVQVSAEIGYANVGGAEGGGNDAAEPFSLVPMLLIWGAVFVGMWFLMIRPQRKREKAMKELQAGIGTGDDIITSGGLFGKVADVGEDCFIVEFGTNRGLRVPVLKADVVARRTPKMTPQPKDTEL